MRTGVLVSGGVPHRQMGFFQGQQNCENKRGAQKGPELRFYCEAERSDSLSRLDLEL